jgi:hypothetical protein
MYFSTYHWLPLVNGSSRFLPPTYAQLSAELAHFPSRNGAELLSAIGVKGAIVHGDRLEPHDAARWRDADLAGMGLREVARFGVDVVYKFSPVPMTHQLHAELAVPDQLPTGEVVQLPREAMLTFRLLARSGGHALWVHPSPAGRMPARITWEEPSTAQQLIQLSYLELPLAIGAEETFATQLSVKAPALPGNYVLGVSLPALGLLTAPKRVRIIPDHDPQSAKSPRLLSAAYALESPSSEVISSGDITVSLQVTNTGAVLWPAATEDDRGEVRLGWRWFKEQQGIPLKEEGRQHLPYDVFPGQAHRFRTTIHPPSEPGEYTLELGLVSELITWFSDQGVAPVKLAVRVPGTQRPFAP